MAMAAFEELDHSMSPLGELVLRRREVLSLDRTEVYEVKLAGVLLMSSIVNHAEIALAEVALPLLAEAQCDVLVGGLGLGYTAKAALDAKNVSSVCVVEFLNRVITWHRGGLVPLGETLRDDDRCTLTHGDFFAVVGSAANHDVVGEAPASDSVTDLGARRFHAILLDIDHSPQLLLHAGHGEFYTSEGLLRLTDHLLCGGVFALWSADPPQESLLAALRSAFETVSVHDVEFFNPLLDIQEVNHIVVAQRGLDD